MREGALLAAEDHAVRCIAAETMDKGGLSERNIRMANVLSYVVLKAHAFHERGEPKDAYDLIFVPRFFAESPTSRMAKSRPVADHPLVDATLKILGEERIDPCLNGVVTCAGFFGTRRGDEALATRAREPTWPVRLFHEGWGSGPATPREPSA